MSYSWEAVERRMAKKAQTAPADSAGEFAEMIGASTGEMHVDEPDFGETAADRRFDQVVEVFSRSVAPAVARQLARDLMAMDEKVDRAVAAEAVGGDLGVGLEERLAGKFRGLLFEIKNAVRPALHVRCVLMALGWADERVESMRKCAADHNLSPEAVSKVVCGVQQRHQLPKSQFNKSAAMVATYKRTNSRA